MPTSSSFDTRIILVVDDEPAITETMVLVLNHANQRLFAIGSTDISEAIAIVSGLRPDLVLLDVMMPGANRLEHAIKMRDKCGCCVLLMSGQTNTSEVIEAEVAAGNTPFDIIAKPIHPTALIQKIQDMLQQVPLSEWKNPLSFRVQ